MIKSDVEKKRGRKNDSFRDNYKRYSLNKYN